MGMYSCDRCGYLMCGYSAATECGCYDCVCEDCVEEVCEKSSCEYCQDKYDNKSCDGCDMVGALAQMSCIRLSIERAASRQLLRKLLG